MASIYGLLRVANLELFHGGIDYETMWGYSDAVVEASFITPAEETVIGATGNTWTSSTATIPVTNAVKWWARYNAMRQAVEDGKLETESLKPTLSEVIRMTGINPAGLLTADSQEHADTRGIWIIKG